MIVKTWLGVLGTLGVLVTAGGCDRADCDRAIESVCACPGIDCAASPPSVIAALERCDSDEILFSGNLSICVTDSDGYCAAARAMLAQDDSICSLDCNVDTCDLHASCKEYQYAQCDRANQGGAK